MITIASKRRKLENLQAAHPGAEIIDVTSKGSLPYLRFSPFYPIGGIPIPHSQGLFSQSVEGIWQGLKVFEGADVDRDKFNVTTMKGLKRTVRKFGVPKGHRKGVFGSELLDYITARKEIYLPAYRWVLENRLQNEVRELKAIAQAKGLVLLDYETNEDIDNPRKPLSHAGLVKKYILGEL